MTNKLGHPPQSKQQKAPIPALFPKIIIIILKKKPSQVGYGTGTYPGDDGAGAGGDEQEQAEGLQEPAHGAGAGAVSPLPMRSAAAPRLPPYITPSSSATVGFFFFCPLMISE